MFPMMLGTLPLTAGASSWSLPRQLLAFSTLGCGELQLEEVAALARGQGFTSVELRALGGTVDLPSYFEQRFGSPDGLRRFLQTANISVCALDTSLSVIGATPFDRAEFLRFVPWAIAAGAPFLRAFDGGASGDDAEIASARETLDWWQAERRAGGWPVDLMVETHDALCQPAALGRFLAAFPECPMLWDSFHTWAEGRAAPESTWAQLRRQTVHIHVKDAVADPDPARPYVVPGSGRFPFGELLDVLRGDSFAGVVSLEWERLWYPALPPIEQALAGFGEIFGIRQCSDLATPQ